MSSSHSNIKPRTSIVIKKLIVWLKKINRKLNSPGRCRYRYADIKTGIYECHSHGYQRVSTILCDVHDDSKLSAFEELALRQRYSWMYGFVNVDISHRNWIMGRAQVFDARFADRHLTPHEYNIVHPYGPPDYDLSSGNEKNAQNSRVYLPFAQPDEIESAIARYGLILPREVLEKTHELEIQYDVEKPRESCQTIAYYAFREYLDVISQYLPNFFMTPSQTSINRSPYV
jgi:hypothetical protein